MPKPPLTDAGHPETHQETGPVPSEIRVPEKSEETARIAGDKQEGFSTGGHLSPQGRPPLTEAEVLIADDMPIFRQLLTGLLLEYGISKIESVDNGRLALWHFFHHQPQPHLVFLDIDMPALDGLAVLKQIKQESPDCFVCMVSGNSTLLNVRQARADGADAFLVKPISLLNLKRVMALYQKSVVSTKNDENIDKDKNDA
ncbi:MAG: response regulator [Pseudomonadota bacterium]